jgi:phospholipid/cholesterol/gamma-HCH transport system permease protein
MPASTAEASHEEAAWIHTESGGRGGKIHLGGEWIVLQSADLDKALHKLQRPRGNVELDCTEIQKLDSTGVWLIVRTKRQLEDDGAKVTISNLPERYRPLLEDMAEEHTAPPAKIPQRHTFDALLERVGRGTMDFARQGYGMLGYLGRVTVEATEVVYKPRGNLRVAALITQIEETGLNALPIVGLLAFLIGVVLAYQGADQLKRFGAEIFTINLLGVGVLREVGGLITAIVVAGRSGSAFTAQIGTMRVNEEIDAMQTIGINTVDALVLPRIIGLVITLPLLTFYANVMAMIGGAAMCYLSLDITIPSFLRHLYQAIELNTFLVGMIKAPVFAFVIALVGCYEGLRVERNAESVGKQTTRSVVESVFLVIALDAAFSIVFSVLGI